MLHVKIFCMHKKYTGDVNAIVLGLYTKIKKRKKSAKYSGIHDV